MADPVTEINLTIDDDQPPRGVFLTKVCRKEFDALDGKCRGFLIEIKTWAWAKERQFEPQPTKFKRLGKCKTGRQSPPIEVQMCEFKYKTVRIYGHETKRTMREVIILVSVTGNDKSGQAGKKQNASIKSAAQRAGELYE